MRSLKDIFKGLYYIVTRSRGFCNRRGKSGALVGKRQGPVIEKCCLNNVLMICLFCGGGIEDEDTWRQKNDQTWFFIPSHLPFEGIFFLNQHIHFFVHGHSSWSTFTLHLVRGPNDFIIWILRNHTMEVGPWSWDHGKRPSSMVRFHCPWCKPALSQHHGG